jgi:hypothetical protein
MPRAFFIFVCIVWLAALAAPPVGAQVSGPPNAATSTTATAVPATGSPGSAQTVDGVAVRIEDDILTESEVRELARFQQLVDGRAKARDEIIRELSDQWIVRGEADTVKYPEPSPEDIQNAYAQLAAQFSSPEEFRNRCNEAGISEAAVRRLLAQQLYLSRFLDYRFRPAAQVDDKQIETYYNDDFAPQLKARQQAVPPLDDVTDTIREVLVQRAISDRATQWLDETRARLKIDVMPQGKQP